VKPGDFLDKGSRGAKLYLKDCGMKEKIIFLAKKYKLRIIYAFGSRAKEALNVIEGRMDLLPCTSSDLDIGVKPERLLTVEEKVEIALFFEDLFNVSRVDVVVLPDAPVFLALEIVIGEILYSQDDTYEAEYQLYIMRMAADLLPYEREKQKMIMGA
jgi:predicted nucleotidyltransferase